MTASCQPATSDAIAEAAEALAAGGLAIVPTDTVYGIAADVRRDPAVEALYAAKGKGHEAPMQLLFAPDAALIERYGIVAGAAEALIRSLGPGGWTIIVPAVDGWSSPALAGGRSVGVRVPATPVVHELVRRLGAPLAATSANRHGEPSPATCEQALGGVGAACAIALDAGATLAGIDSTVIDCVGPIVRILREGAIDRQTVARILGMNEIEVLRSVRP